MNVNFGPTTQIPGMEKKDVFVREQMLMKHWVLMPKLSEVHECVQVRTRKKNCINWKFLYTHNISFFALHILMFHIHFKHIPGYIEF